MGKDRGKIKWKRDAVQAFVLREGEPARVLLLQRRSKNFDKIWDMAGGGVDPGESPVQALLREVREETGLTPCRLYSADHCLQYYHIDREAICITPVFVAFVEATSQVNLSDEHRDWRWCAMEEALTMLPFTPHRDALRHVWTHFVDEAPNHHLQIPLA